MPNPEKNPAAVALGRKGGQAKGQSKARTPAQAASAARARWDRLGLIRQVYSTVFDNSESFQDDDQIGADLAYLTGAIAHNEKFDTTTIGRKSAMVAILRLHLAESHPVWKFIVI